MTNDARRRAMNIIARYAMNTLSCYRLDYFNDHLRDLARKHAAWATNVDVDQPER